MFLKRPFLCALVLFGTRLPRLAARPLLVFLIDGFRHDYVGDLQNLPGFGELVHHGVKVDYMTPDFPSLSFPNYYTLMTGRHCDNHQMTGNYMWDEVSKAEFLIGTNPDSKLPLWWNGSEPIWVTLQKLGKKVFMYYWPGCEVEILGVRPSFCEEYISSPSEKNLTDSIGKALNVLSSGEANMAAIYYENIDVQGHHWGPDSEQVRTAVRQLDGVMQKLNSKIKEINMANKLNIIILSDHGMTKIQWMEKVIELDKHVNLSDIVKTMDRGSVVSLWPKDDKYQKVYAALAQVPNMRVYGRQDVPERFHYKGGKFVSPLTLVAEPGWFISKNKAALPYWNNGSATSTAWQNGWHGYDNEFLDMRAFFLATGPGSQSSRSWLSKSRLFGHLDLLYFFENVSLSIQKASSVEAFWIEDFKRNVRAAPIQSVDVYNLMCRTLGIEPLPNNGSWSRVEYLLSSSDVLFQHKMVWPCCILFTSILLMMWG